MGSIKTKRAKISLSYFSLSFVQSQFSIQSEQLQGSFITIINYDFTREKIYKIWCLINVYRILNNIKLHLKINYYFNIIIMKEICYNNNYI